MSRMPALISLVLLAACARSSAPTQANAKPADDTPVVEVQAVPAATVAEGAVARKAGAPVATKVEADPAVIARRVESSRPIPAVLEATDERIASMDQDVAGVEDGQLWVMVDEQMPGPDAVADAVGAASFGEPGMVDEGTWAAGCARLRADIIGTTVVEADEGEVMPSWEIVPGTLRVASSEAEARNLRLTELNCR